MSLQTSEECNCILPSGAEIDLSLTQLVFPSGAFSFHDSLRLTYRAASAAVSGPPRRRAGPGGGKSAID